MSNFVAFCVGSLASSACMWELSLALDEYSASANPRRYRGVLEPTRGPSALNWSIYTAEAWSKGEHPKFTDLRHKWNSGVVAARDAVVNFFDASKK